MDDCGVDSGRDSCIEDAEEDSGLAESDLLWRIFYGGFWR